MGHQEEARVWMHPLECGRYWREESASEYGKQPHPVAERAQRKQEHQVEDSARSVRESNMQYVHIPKGKSKCQALTQYQGQNSQRK